MLVKFKAPRSPVPKTHPFTCMKRNILSFIIVTLGFLSTSFGQTLVPWTGGDDGPAIQNALNSSTNVVLEAGQVYQTSVFLKLPTGTVFDGKGSTIKPHANLPVVNSPIISTSYTTTLSETNLTISVTKGLNTFDYANASNIQPGQIVILYGPTYSSYGHKYGWYGLVSSVSGTTVTLANSATKTYVASSIKVITPASGIHLKNINFDLKGRTIGTGPTFMHAANSFMEVVGVQCDPDTTAGINTGIFAVGTKLQLYKCNIQNIRPLYTGFGSSAMELQGSDITVSFPYIRNAQTCISCTSRTFMSTGIKLQNVDLDNGVGSDYTIDYTGNSTGIITGGTVAVGPNALGAVSARQSDLTIQGIVFKLPTYARGILFYENAVENLTISNNRFESSGTPVTVQAIANHSKAIGPTKNLRIFNNVFLGGSIYLNGPIDTGLIVSNNWFETSNGFQSRLNLATTSVVNYVVTKNTFVNRVLNNEGNYSILTPSVGASGTIEKNTVYVMDVANTNFQFRINNNVNVVQNNVGYIPSGNFISDASADPTLNTLFNNINNPVVGTPPHYPSIPVPTIWIPSPNSGTVFYSPASITIRSVPTSSSGGIDRVEFYNNGVLIGTVTTAPYNLILNSPALGNYSVRAKVVDTLGASAMCSPTTFSVVANTPPTVSMSAPTDGSVYYTPVNVTLAANASDTDGSVSKVDFYNGSTLLGTSTTAPYQFIWNNVPAGSYSITAVATDNNGGVTTSAPIGITVKTNSAPSVTVGSSSSLSNLIAPASVGLTATASDVDGTIAKVEFYNGTTLLGTDTTSPYAFNWNSIPAGTYSITAKATDNLGATTTSAPMSVVVKNNTAPSVLITSPLNTAVFTALADISISANASDSDGSISKVEFYNGNTLIGTVTSSPYTMTWSAVGVGTYSLTAKATDNLGLSTTSSVISVTVKPPNVAPTVSLTSPTSGATFTAPANITVSANASDSDGTISKVEFYNGATLIGTSTTAPYSVTWNSVAAGNYTLTARATDNSGTTTTSAGVSITVKAPNVPPTVSITAPTAGTTFTAPANITISANASDSDGTVAKVEFFNGSTLIGTSTVAPYSVTWNSVAAGNYTLTAKATDNSGAATTSAGVSITVKAPNVPPNVSISSPANNATFTAPANITLTATASDTDGTISKVEFYNGTTLIGTSTTSPYTVAWNSVAAGTYSITAKATDNSGAVTTSTAISITVKAPNVAPTVSISSPASGATFTSPANITVTATASDSDGTISKVEFYNGANLIGTSTTAPYSIAWNSVASGSYTLTAKATDNSGASTTSSGVNITVKAPNAAPTVSITAPSAGASFTAPANISISANASDSDGSIAKVEFFSGTTLIGTSSVAPFSITWNSVAAGSYTLKAKATDNLGASTTSAGVSISVKAANVAPTVSISSPANNSTFAAPANISITASASDSDGTVSKVEFYNGTSLIGTATASPYTIAWNSVVSGTYSLTAKATDNSGASTTSAAISITVKANLPPTVTLANPASTSSLIAPATITLSATASDSDGTVTKVDFYNGTTLLGTSTTPPYKYVWSNVAAGTYSITAKATDNMGAVGTSSVVSVTVNVNSLPSVSITSPAPEDVLSADSSITVQAVASDSDGSISQVKFYSNGNYIGADSTSPYSFTWIPTETGTLSLTAVAVDNLGGSKTSAAVQVSVVGVPTAKRTFYVSSSDPAASDSNPGTIDQPWKTMTKVTNFIASATRHFPGDHILFKRGDSFYDNLYIKQSGTPEDPIVFGAYGTGPKPVISGFVSLESWVSAGNGIYYAALPSDPNTLLVNGVMTGKGRYPKGTYNFLKYESSSTTNASITDVDLPASPSWVGAEAVIHTAGTEWMRRKVINQSGGTLFFSTADSYNNGFAYFFQNDMKCLTQFGDWMYNSTEKRVYFYFGTTSPQTCTVEASQMVEGISIRGCHDIIITDLLVEGVTGGGISLSNPASFVTVQFCESQFNGTGLGTSGGSNDVWRCNYIHDSTDKGITAPYSSKNITIENNTVKDSGMLLGAGPSGNSCGAGIYSEGGEGYKIRRNKVIHTGYLGIRAARGSNTLIEENLVQGYGYNKDDNGGILFWRSDTDPDFTNRVVRRNIVVDGRPEIASAGNNARRQNGLYADQRSCNILFEGNIIVSPFGYGYINNSSTRNNTLKDNIFFNASRNGIHWEKYSSNATNEWTNMNVTGNVIVMDNTRTNDEALFIKTHNADLSKFGICTNNTYVAFMTNAFVRNLAYTNGTRALTTEYSLTGWQTNYSLEKGSKWMTRRDANLRAEYNETTQLKTISFAGKTYKDIKTGTLYTGSVTLQPFTGKVLQYVGP